MHIRSAILPAVALTLALATQAPGATANPVTVAATEDSTVAHPASHVGWTSCLSAAVPACDAQVPWMRWVTPPCAASAGYCIGAVSRASFTPSLNQNEV